MIHFIHKGNLLRPQERIMTQDDKALPSYYHELFTLALQQTLKSKATMITLQFLAGLCKLAGLLQLLLSLLLSYLFIFV